MALYRLEQPELLEEILLLLLEQMLVLLMVHNHGMDVKVLGEIECQVTKVLAGTDDC